MKSSEHLTPVSQSTAEVNTLLTYTELIDCDAAAQALLSDVSTESFGDAYRGLGLTRATFWMQRDPDASVIMWEGRDVDTLFERFAVSSNPVLARWRGQLRVLSGPAKAESFWDASRHRLLCWATGEQGAESEITVYRDAQQVEAYLRLAHDFQNNPSLMGLLDRVRRRQGFTRIDTWHQQTDGDDILLTLVEAHDLNAAMAQLMKEDNELDRRTMDVVRSTFLQTASPPPSAKLIARWHA